MTKGQEGIQTRLMVLILSKATVHKRKRGMCWINRERLHGGET